MSNPETNKTPVVVTTSYRGVFFGYLAGDVGETVTITDARLCVRWRDTHGFLGLAQDGPNAKCRIGPAVPELTLLGVTSVTRCTDKAVEAWEAEPWKV